jgi:hypothetical protein
MDAIVHRSPPASPTNVTKPSIAMPPYLSEIQHGFEAAPQPTRRLGLHAPNRFKHLHHQRGINGGNRQIAEYRISVGAQRRLPLSSVLFDVRGGALGKCHRPGGVQPCGDLPLALRVDGINASAPKPTGLPSGVTRHCQRDVTDRPQTHFPDPAVGLVAIEPNLASAIGNTQHQTAAVAVVAGLLGLFDRPGCQPIIFAWRHSSLSLIPTSIPTRITGWSRVSTNDGEHADISGSLETIDLLG